METLDQIFEKEAETIRDGWYQNIPDWITKGEVSPVEEDPREALIEDFIELENEIKQREYRAEPSRWVTEKLGEQIWSKQEEILQSLVDHRRTAVPSCFDAGKSFIAARAAAWWIDTHPPGKAFVITTASRFSQVRAILWRELRRAHAKGNLAGRVNQTEWHLDVNGQEELVAFGRKPSDEDETGFHGVHTRWVLGIGDEAAGLSRILVNSMENMIANEESRLLYIGNPDESNCEFKDMCKPGSGSNVIQIKAWDTPNFTDEDSVNADVKRELISKIWVEEKAKRWGKKSTYYLSKVEAEFPETSTDGLIPMAWIREAQERTLEPKGANELGVDVGGGHDKNVMAHRIGPVVRIKHRDQNPDTMETCGNAVALMKKVGATSVKVDSIGIGHGVADRGKELGHPFVAINVAQSPEHPDAKKKRIKNKEEGVFDSERFVNLRAKCYWAIRERFQDGNIDIDPEDVDLAAQLVEIRYKRTSAGKIQIESKEEYIARLKDKGDEDTAHSPDDADALMLAYAELPEAPKRQKGAAWGKR